MRRVGALRALVLLHPLAGAAVLSSGCLATNATPATSGEDASVPGEDAGQPVIDSTTPVDSSDATLPPTDSTVANDSAVQNDSTVPNDSAPEAAVDAADAAPGIGAITGKVLDVNQFSQGAVAGATVSVVGGPSTTTDLNGVFSLAGVTAGSRVLLTVTTPSNTGAGIAYSTAQVVVPVVAGETSEVYPQVIEGCIATGAVGVDAGATLTLQNGCSGRTGAFVSIAFDPGGLVDSTGSPFDGTVRLEAIPLAFAPGSGEDGGPDLSWGAALPGDMSAIESDGGLVKLESAGATELRVYDDATGNPLSIATGHAATLQMAAYRTPNAGETFESWYYDLSTGMWVEDGLGSFVTVDAGVNGFNVYQVQVSHLTWWNIDHPISDTGCVTGVLTAGGVALPSAYLSGTGADFLGGLVSYSQGTVGAFCMDGLGGGHANIAVGHDVSATLGYRAALSGVPLSAPGTSCTVNTSQCTNLGTVALTAVTPGCYAGSATLGPSGGGATIPISSPIAYYETGHALTAAQQSVGYTNDIYLGSVVPDDAGSFCMPFVPGTEVVAFAPPGIGGGCHLLYGGYQDITFPDDAGAGAACGSDACVPGSIYFGCS